MIRKIIKALWIFLAVIVLAIVIVFVSISKGWIGYMPPVEELENPSYKFATEIFSEDEKVLGTWSYSKENRVYTAYKDLSPSIINALIATEDVRFVEHSGIDAKALFRAFVKRGLMFQKNAGGGSTLSQQLAKQLYTENVARNTHQRLYQKPIEWVIAVKLERYYTKEEILSMYLNKFDFLNNAVGIKTAAYTYFGCEPMGLKIEEAATLVGMCKNPSLYNPVRFNERSRGRRNVVLEQMRKAGYITDAECDSLQALPLKLTYNRVDHKEGLATYFREYLRGVMTAPKPVRSDYRGWQMQKFYEDSIAWETNPLYGWCAKIKKKDGTNYNIYTDGLKIYTTIYSRMQQYAEADICRRRILLSYFGETTTEDCGNCDGCKNPPQRFDGTVIVQKALSAIARTEQQISIGLLIDILRGNYSAEVTGKGYQELKTFGAGRDIPPRDWQDYLLQMLQLGYFEIAYYENNHLKITSSGSNVLFGRTQAALVVIQHEEAVTRKGKKKKVVIAKELPFGAAGGESQDLFEALRGLRKQLADQEALPAYIVLSDKVLHLLCISRPTTIEEFGEISGIGEHKKKKYGKDFVNLIRQFVE